MTRKKKMTVFAVGAWILFPALAAYPPSFLGVV